jgi:hypothetical protein
MNPSKETRVAGHGVSADTLARRMGATAHRSPLRRHAVDAGLRDEWDLLALAVQRGCRHVAGVASREAVDPGRAVLDNEQLIVLLLAGENPFQPFLVRAAAELLRAARIDGARLAWLARRERCAPVLAHIARAGAEHDADAREFWRALLVALGPQRPAAPGVLPHWTRFAVLQGMNRGGRPNAARWVGSQR